MPVLGIDLMLVLPFSGFLKHQVGRAGMWGVQGGHCVCECTVVQGQMPTLPKHTRTLSPSVGPSIPAVGGEEGNAALLLPLFQQRGSQAASRLAASHEGIITISADSIHFPAAMTAARWL